MVYIFFCLSVFCLGGVSQSYATDSGHRWFNGFEAAVNNLYDPFCRNMTGAILKEALTLVTHYKFDIHNPKVRAFLSRTVLSFCPRLNGSDSDESDTQIMHMAVLYMLFNQFIAAKKMPLTKALFVRDKRIQDLCLVAYNQMQPDGAFLCCVGSALALITLPLLWVIVSDVSAAWRVS